MDTMKVLIASLTVSVFVVQSLAQVPTKWCTLSDAEQKKCQDFQKALSDNGISPGINCIKVLHQAQCLRMINKGDMDVISIDDKGIYSAGKKFNLKPIVNEKRTGPDAENFFYKAVIVVKKSDTSIQNIKNLQGKRSCHTGVMKTVGWVIPVGVLSKYGGMTPVDCDNNVKNIAAYFRQSCAPGAFDPYNNPGNDNPQKVCGACDQAKCPLKDSTGITKDKYSGYEGAFRGLVDDKCDVAFVKHSTVIADAKTKFDYKEADYQLLCNSTANPRQPVSAWKDCHWATRPFRAMVARSGYTKDFVTMMTRAKDLFGPGGSKTSQFQLFASSKYGGEDLMFSDDSQTLEESHYTDYKAFLGEGYLDSYELFRPKTVCNESFRWCAISDEEMNKCQEMGLAFSARRITQDFSCVRGKNTDDCFDLIKAGKADLLTVDGGHLYRGGKYFDLRPIAAELYDASLPGNQPSSYYAVAVALKSNQNVKLNDLRGKKTCHTGFERTSGWNVPVGYLVEKGDIKFDTNTCNIGEGAANFFGDMCTPGALEPEYNPKNNHPKKMCALCPQDCGSGGKYAGYSGAIKCLIEKSADVAFVKHSTVASLFKGERPKWLKAGINLDDFELLCNDGSRKPVAQWQNCNLARVPSHAVVTSKSKKPGQVKHYQYALYRAQLKFGTKEDGSAKDSFFSIFKSSQAKNLLFKDSTKQLRRVMESSYENFLGSEYLDTVQALDSRKCFVGSASSVQISLMALVVGFILSIYW